MYNNVKVNIVGFIKIKSTYSFIQMDGLNLTNCLISWIKKFYSHRDESLKQIVNYYNYLFTVISWSEKKMSSIKDI